jgi:hypothetical protein
MHVLCRDHQKPINLEQFKFSNLNSRISLFLLKTVALIFTEKHDLIRKKIKF